MQFMADAFELHHVAVWKKVKRALDLVVAQGAPHRRIGAKNEDWAGNARKQALHVVPFEHVGRTLEHGCEHIWVEQVQILCLVEKPPIILAEYIPCPL